MSKSSKNSNLHKAKKTKNDEYYTRLEDIENEVCHYESFFENKIVLCNCDDPLESNFTKYFILRFHALKLKKLICTFYDVTNTKVAYAFEYEGQDLNGDGRVSESDIDIIRKTKAYHTELVDDDGYCEDNKIECWKNGIYGKGDFRSKNCIEYIKMADIVVTNPPFSLFREYIAQIIEYDKKYLIIGNKNEIPCKDIFPYVKENKLWFGITKPNIFFLPNGETTTDVQGLCRWFTNIPNRKRNTELDLYKTYKEDKYPKYDEYNAIDVKYVVDIPVGYDGIMGVPITFIDKYCPSQFEILGLDRYVDDNPHYGRRFTINGKQTYARILIRWRVS